MTRIVAGTVVATVMTLALSAPTARADEHRGGDAALGALSGAVVFGPVGAVAGAVVGYTAGPSIARSWGFRQRSARHARRPAREAHAEVPPSRGGAGAVARPAPAPAVVGPKAPAVQTLE